MVALVLADGIDEMLRFVEDLPDTFVEAAYRAVNDTAERTALPGVKRRMRKQVNFPAAYLENRIKFQRKATRATLEAVIRGRDRPTSLARFAEGATLQNSRGRPIFVKVSAAGGAKQLDRAFLIKLRNGNTGLAIRLPKGQTPDRAYKPVQLTTRGGRPEDVWLLYGPSVDQVMSGVVDETSGDVLEALGRNFLRQLDRLLTRG